MIKSTSSSKLALKEGRAEAERRIAECFKTKSDKLDLIDLGLKTLPHSLRKLTWLNDLYVQGNKISHIPEWLGELSELQSLLLFDNPIETLPKSLSQLSQLETLFLTNGTPAAANEVIASLSSLKELSLQTFGLTHFPDWLRSLGKLERLFVGNNKLKEIPEWIGELSHLEWLTLNNNNLHSLPNAINELNALIKLDVSGNTELNLPAEIQKDDNARKVLDYYFRTTASGAAQPLNEFKLILVGRGLVGKTSLVHRLVTGKFKKFQRTPGINITKWPRKIDGDNVHAHIWDFGGQEIMHGTHRFFMTERALYLVVISGREGTEDYDAEYWLSMVRSFAGDVPVIVLLNKWDDYRFELNRELLREKYGKDIIFIGTDSATDTGITELREQICAHAKRLPGLKASWPVEWRQIKDELPAQKKSWLTFNDFRTFCHNHGITTAKDQEDLAESLHDLGLMLSYRKEEALRSFGVLNPAWVTDGIYKLLLTFPL